MANLIIKLGPHGSRFGQPAGDMTLLGTVQQDAAIGALARSADGTYWQLNGDHHRKLNASRVTVALRAAEQRLSARDAQGGSFASTRSRAAPAPAPVVTVKRRRVVVMPQA